MHVGSSRSSFRCCGFPALQKVLRCPPVLTGNLPQNKQGNTKPGQPTEDDGSKSDPTGPAFSSAQSFRWLTDGPPGPPIGTRGTRGWKWLGDAYHGSDPIEVATLVRFQLKLHIFIETHRTNWGASQKIAPGLACSLASSERAGHSYDLASWYPAALCGSHGVAAMPCLCALRDWRKARDHAGTREQAPHTHGDTHTHTDTHAPPATRPGFH